MSSLLEGGISGFTWEGEAAASGDLSGNVTSIDGSELDAGNFSGGPVWFPGGLGILSLSFNVPGPVGSEDSVLVLIFGTQTLSGDWTLRPGQAPDPVPEPASLLLVGLGALGMIVRKKRRQR